MTLQGEIRVTPQVTPQVTTEVTPQVEVILAAAREPALREELPGVVMFSVTN